MPGQSQASYTKQVDEPCPDCGCRPISGQFVVLGRFPDPIAMRAQIIATGVVDVRVVGAELHSLVDWTCQVAACAKKKTFDVSPIVRLAQRAKL